MRTDLPLGNQFAQCVHAAGETSPGPTLPDDTHAVVLAARNEEELLRYAYRLETEGIPHKLIREPDMANAATAIGVFPITRERVRRLLAKLPLLR